MDINANTSNLVYQNLLSEFDRGIQSADPISDPLWETVPSTSNANVYSWLKHIPGYKEWFNGQPRVIRNVESTQFTVANRKFEDTIAISVDEVEDNQLGQYNGIARSMGAEGMLLKDELIFELFNNAFTTALTYDGLSICNAAHKAGLSTINNTATAALSSTSFEAAIATIENYKYKADKYSEAKPLTKMMELCLVIPPALRPTAENIVNVQRLADGADNYLYKRADLLISPYLTNATQWFLVNKGAPNKPFFVQDRKPLEFRELNPSNSDQSIMFDEFVYAGKCRLAALPTHFWLIYGSTGTG